MLSLVQKTKGIFFIAVILVAVIGLYNVRPQLFAIQGGKENNETVTFKITWFHLKPNFIAYRINGKTIPIEPVPGNPWQDVWTTTLPYHKGSHYSLTAHVDSDKILPEFKVTCDIIVNADGYIPGPGNHDETTEPGYLDCKG